MTILTDVDSVTIIHNGGREAGHAQTKYVILRTNIARCALIKEILDLLDEKSASGARSCRANL